MVRDGLGKLFFSIKDQIVNTLGSVKPMVSVDITQLFIGSLKAAIDNKNLLKKA